MQQENIHTAKSNLSSLVEKASADEPFVIANAGRPLVIISPYAAPVSCSRVGFM